MNILFLSIVGLKNVDQSGLYTDVLREFRDHGHNVFAVGVREKRLGLPSECILDHGIVVLKVKTGNITKTNALEKGLSTLEIERLFLREIKKHFSEIKFDLILYSTPPITFDKVIRYIKERDRAKSYLLLKDIFPQNAVDLNIFSKLSPIYWYFRHREKNLYKISDYIGCMSNANVDFILRYNTYLNKDAVEVCPNTVEPKSFKSNKVDKNDIREKLEIPIDKTIFLYGGNLGKPQGIDFLKECITANENHKQSFFLIIGSGTEFSKLENFFDKTMPRNSKLLKSLPQKEYDALANSCNVGLIFLDRRFTIPNFPSRILSYMQASMPVLAATDTNTDVGRVITEGQFGYWCESGDTERFFEHVEKLCDEKTRESLGKNSRKYLEEHYTAKHSYDIIMRHFKD